MTQSGKNKATALFCLMALAPVLAANDPARRPMPGLRTAIKLIAGEAARTSRKHTNLCCPRVFDYLPAFRGLGGDR